MFSVVIVPIMDVIQSMISLLEGKVWGTTMSWAEHGGCQHEQVEDGQEWG